MVLIEKLRAYADNLDEADPGGGVLLERAAGLIERLSACCDDMATLLEVDDFAPGTDSYAVVECSKLLVKEARR